MRRSIEQETLQLSPRVVLRPGEQFRAGRGGPRYGKDSLGVRGAFECRRIWRRGSRVFVDCVEIAAIEGKLIGYGRAFTLFVEGKPYRSAHCPGVVHVPYKLRRLAVA